MVQDSRWAIGRCRCIVALIPVGELSVFETSLSASINMVVVLKFAVRFWVVAAITAGAIAAGTNLSAASGSSVAPRVVSAEAGDGFAQVTIADMSPDTGVYAVQWVPQGQDFNSYHDVSHDI